MLPKISIIEYIVSSGLLASIVGAVVGMGIDRPAHWLDIPTRLAAGTALTWWGSPVIIQYFNLQSQEAVSFIGLFCGLFGMVTISMILRILKNTTSLQDIKKLKDKIL